MIDSQEINIRLATQEDGAEVCNLLKKLGLTLPEEENRRIEHWNRLWSQNPYYDYFEEDVLYGWVMEHKERIVGFFGSIPRVYCLDSQLIRISVGSHWGVEKAYRGYTTRLCSKFFNENPIALKLATTAIKPSARIFERYGGKRIPDPDLGWVYMVPINLVKLIALKYKYPTDSNWLKYLSYLIPWRLQFRLILRNKKVRELNINQLPADFDHFLTEFSRNTKGLIAFRSQSIFEWIYAKESRKGEKKHFVYTEDGKTLGYASIVNEPLKENRDIIRYKVVDLIAANIKIKKAILKELIRYSHKQSADILEIHHPGMINKSEIPALLVMKREYSYFPLYYQTTDTDLAEILEDKGIWNISPFDGDTTL